MRHLIQQYYHKWEELHQEHNRIEYSWNQLFITGSLRSIKSKQTGVTITGNNNSLTQPTIILYLVTTWKLTDEQIQLIEKESDSVLFDIDRWTEIDLKDYTKPNEKKLHYGYNFVVQDIVAPGIIESWLKD